MVKWGNDLSDDEIWTVAKTEIFSKTRGSIAIPVLIRKRKKREKERRASVAERLAKKEARRDWTLALILLLVYVVLSVSTSQLTNYVFTEVKFDAPYLFTVIKIAFRISLFPVYLSINALSRVVHHKHIHLGKTIRHCEEIFGAKGLTLRVLCVRMMPAVISMLLQQITYTFGMANLSASVTTSLYILGAAIAYIMSWLILKQKLLLIKSIFVLFSFCGVTLISYASFTEGVTSKTVIGLVSTFTSVILLVVHQFTLKMAFPRGDLAQVAFGLAMLNIIITLVVWPVPVITKITGLEVYDINLMPYHLLIPNWIMSAVSSVVYGYGLVLSSPFFMSIGELMILTANTAIDGLFRGIVITTSQLIGTVLVGIAFIGMILPDKLVSVNLRGKPQMAESDAPHEEDMKSQLDEQLAADEAREFVQNAVPSDAISVMDDADLSSSEDDTNYISAAKNYENQTKF